MSYFYNVIIKFAKVIEFVGICNNTALAKINEDNMCTMIWKNQFCTANSLTKYRQGRHFT